MFQSQSMRLCYFANREAGLAENPETGVSVSVYEIVLFCLGSGICISHNRCILVSVSVYEIVLFCLMSNDLRSHYELGFSLSL